MRFDVDDQNLSVIVELDLEPAALRLDGEDGLGDQILDAAVAGMLAAVARTESPAGDAWGELRPSTIAAKGHATIGIRTGALLNPANWTSGPRTVEPRLAVWTFGAVSGKALGFHNGRPGVQPARELVGWTDRAKAEAHQLVADALFRLDSGGEVTTPAGPAGDFEFEWDDQGGPTLTHQWDLDQGEDQDGDQEPGWNPGEWIT